MPARSASRAASCTTAASSATRSSGAIAGGPADLIGSARDGATIAEPCRRHRIERPALDTAQPRSGVLAERRAVIAALLDGHQTAPEPGDPAADLVVHVRREGE